MSGLGGLENQGGLLAELSDGSLVLGASHNHHAKLEIVLRRVTPDCHTVGSFGKNGTLTTTVDEAHYGGIDVIRATPDGKLLLAGSDGRNELVGRLLATGQIDSSFGQGGWTRFKPKVKNPFPGMPSSRLATSIAFGRSGSIFLGGNDDTAHCCTQDFVSELTANGALVRSFGNGGSVVVPRMSGSYITEVSANRDGSVYAFAEYEQSGCGYPLVLRFRSDGSLDSRFDAAMVQTFQRVAPKQIFYAPTLVPGRAGAFALVGGYYKSCGPLSRNTPSSGLAVGVLPSGRIDRSFGRSGEARFPASLFDFDNPDAIRLPSGRIVTVTYAYSDRGRPLGVDVREFSSNGAADGSRRIARSKLPRHAGIVGLVPASNGGLWIVMGSVQQVELIPVR